MEKVNTIVKKWGNSFGVILPKKIVDAEKIREGLEVEIIIQTKNKMTVGDLLQFTKKNKLPNLKKTTREIMEEIDRDLWPD